MSNFIPGTVSHGTLRTEDLAFAFADKIHRILAGSLEYTEIDLKYIRTFIDHPDRADEWDLEMLLDTLNELAPEGYYFGAHPGNSSDFGFWEIEDD